MPRNYADLNTEEKIRLILERVLHYRCFDLWNEEHNQLWRSDAFTEERRKPTAFYDDMHHRWSLVSASGSVRDENTFNPLQSIDDAWLIMDHIKPGRAGLHSSVIQDQAKFLIRSRFVQKLAYESDNWWYQTREQLCEMLCRYALEACEGIDKDGILLEEQS